MSKEATGRAIEAFRSVAKAELKVELALQDLDDWLADPEVDMGEYVRLTTQITEVQEDLRSELQSKDLAPSTKRQYLSRLSQVGLS